MTEPHPQRCETCEYSSFNAPGKTCPFVIKAPYVAVVLHCNMAFMASVVGCASHSSTKSESEALLEELKGIVQWDKKFGSDAVMGYIQARITHIERELRQQRRDGKQIKKNRVYDGNSDTCADCKAFFDQNAPCETCKYRIREEQENPHDRHLL